VGGVGADRRHGLPGLDAAGLGLVREVEVAARPSGAGDGQRRPRRGPGRAD
jgi:hypothetical protein